MMKQNADKLHFFFARFEVFTVMKIYFVIFWIVKPCSDVVGYQ